MEFIVLSPFPPYTSGNVGDKLLLESSLDLIEEIHGPTEFHIHFRTEDFTSRLEYLNDTDGILLCGFEYPKLSQGNQYRIAETLESVEPPLIPIGAIHRFFPGDRKTLDNQRLGPPIKSFLERVVPNCPGGKIPVRTDWVGYVLRQNGYETTLTGDPGLYDTDFLGEPFHKPDDIDQLVFTTPHWSLYADQAKELWAEFASQFPKHDLVANAYFWQGECLYQMEKYAQAVLLYDKVISEYEQSGKYPSALLKQGLSLYALDKKKAGRIRLQQLMNDYGDTAEAKRARSFLDGQ